MARCAKAPHLAVCPGYPAYEWDGSLRGFGVYDMPEDSGERILGGRLRQYTPFSGFGSITVDNWSLVILGVILWTIWGKPFKQITKVLGYRGGGGDDEE